MDQNTRKDFFISYTSTDRTWAEWIAWQLEEAGYSTVLQAWDFRPGSNFVLEMDRATQEAERTIAVLSPEYLNGTYTKAEWAAAFRRDPTGEQGLLLPIHVRECKHQLTGLLGSMIYIDLVGLDDMTTTCNTLLAGLQRNRAKPTTSPGFPTGTQHSIPKQPRFPGAFPSAWTIPYQRNPFFTGREDTLKNLYEMLRVGKTVALVQPRALSGLGGIGKTQSAVEYAYRYYSDYPEAILWVRAETHETLISDFVSIASALDLPEKDEQDQNHVVDAVKRWFKDHTDWLLIFDNVDDLAMMKNFIPSARRGHILLTTRVQALGEIAQGIEMDKMEPEEGALLLLRRVNIIGPDTPFEDASEVDHTLAITISKVMDGLPLALDQAGAYIEETRCSMSDYLDFYQKRRRDFLKRRGPPSSDHPESVVATWSLSFEKIERANTAAADLLRFCAFLSPDTIPEEIITEGASELGFTLRRIATDPHMLNEAIAMLLRFSLVHRNRSTKTLSMHRLVQAVLIDNTNKRLQKVWAQRAVRALYQAFPVVKFETWQRCQRYLPHAQICAALIQQWHMEFLEAERLVGRTASYLFDTGQYVEAKPLYEQTFLIGKRVRGVRHSSTATDLNNLGTVCYALEEYDQTEQFYQQALAIRQRVLGPNHSDTASTLNNLAMLYRAQDKISQAELFLHQALSIWKQTLEPNHSYISHGLNNLAALYHDQGKYDQAEPLIQEALKIAEETLGMEHPDTAQKLSNLARLYQDQGRYDQAENLQRRALAIREQVLGLEHTEVSLCLDNLGRLYEAQGRYAQAEPFYQRSLAILEKNLGTEHHEVATCLNMLAFLYYEQGKYNQSEPLYLRVLTICERKSGTESSEVSNVLNNLAALYRDWGKYTQADSLYQRALAIRQKILGPNHLEVAWLLNGLAGVYNAQGKYVQAEQCCRQALAIREQALEPDHVDIAHSFLTLGLIYYAQDKYVQAEPFFVRASMIREKVLGPQHPDVAIILEYYAKLLRKTKQESKAEDLEIRAQQIRANCT